MIFFVELRVKIHIEMIVKKKKQKTNYHIL